MGRDSSYQNVWLPSLYSNMQFTAPETTPPPTHFPFRRAADILSQVRSPMISRSNCASCGEPHYALCGVRDYAKPQRRSGGAACISVMWDSALSRLEQGNDRRV